jgi:hypothetical protein
LPINERLRRDAIEVYQLITGINNVDPDDKRLNAYLLDVVKHHQPVISTAENCCLKVLMAQDVGERKQTLQER